MKKFLFLFLLAIVFTSCEKNVEFNNPAFQGLIDNSLWKATDFSATKSATGAITIKSLSTSAANVELKLNSTALGTRTLGTTNTSNFATYTLENINHATGITASSEIGRASCRERVLRSV